MDELRNEMENAIREFEILETKGAISDDGILMGMHKFLDNDGRIGYSLSITPGAGCDNPDRIVDLFETILKEQNMKEFKPEIMDLITEMQNDLLV